jgi:hypothetical protein
MVTSVMLNRLIITDFLIKVEISALILPKLGKIIY